MARRISEELAATARELAAMDRIARSGNLPSYLTRSNQTLQQFTERFGNLGAAFKEMNASSTRHHRLMTQVDRVQILAQRSAGGLAGAFGRLGPIVGGVARGFGLVVGAATAAATGMERAAQGAMQFANTARDLRETRGSLADAVQGARRLGMTVAEAEKEIIDLTFTLQDLGQRGFGAMTEEMEKLGPRMFDIIAQLEKMDKQGATGAQLREFYIKQFEKLSDREQVYMARAMRHSTALREHNEAMARGIPIIQASEQEIKDYNDAWVTVTTTLENLKTITIAGVWNALKQLNDAIKTMDAEKWNNLFRPKEVAPGDVWTPGLGKHIEKIRPGAGDPFSQPGETGPGGATVPPASTFDERWRGTPLRFMSGPWSQMRRSTNVEDRRGIAVPEGWGGANAIVWTEQLRVGQESNQTLREIRDILQRMETGEAGGGGGGDGGDRAPTFRRGIGPGSRLIDGDSGAPTFRRGVGPGACERGGDGGTEVAPPGPPGTYRPQYKLSDADLSDAVVNKIAGEALRSKSSTDAVINNMFNRLGTKTYGPSGNLREVALAPGQYAAPGTPTDAKRAEFIRSRIRAIASGSEPDITGGSNEFRAAWYRGPWYQRHRDAAVIGGNRFAFNPRGGRGPYTPYETPRSPADAMPPWLPKPGEQPFLDHWSKPVPKADDMFNPTPLDQRRMLDGASGGATWKGSANIDVSFGNVPPGVKVNASQMGFEPIRIARTRQMPRPTSEGGTGVTDFYE